MFVIGGCDEDTEPFSEIYQFVPAGQERKVVGHLTVSRYGTSAVVVTDKNNQQAVFIAGGFKGEGIQCNVIEQIPIITKEDMQHHWEEKKWSMMLHQIHMFLTVIRVYS